jgi:probable HAF family extracellular repeat protein
MVDLGTLGGLSSHGYAINASGQVAGISSVTGNATSHAFRYSGGVMTDLGTLGGIYSEAHAINASGQVVGTSFIAGSETRHAFLSTGSSMIDLDAWLDANNPAEGAKWTLNGAYGLSDTGMITGYGSYDDGPGGLSDGSRAFLLATSKPGLHVLSVGVRDNPSNHGGDISAERVRDAFSLLPGVAAGTNAILTLNTSSGNGRQALEAAVNSMRANPNLKPGDTFIFYINSHGFYDLVGDEAGVLAQNDAHNLTHRELTTGDEHFYLGGPAGSSNNISDDDFSSLFVDSKWQGVNKLFIIDACYAGGFWRPWITGDTGDLARLNKSAVIAASSELDFSWAHLDNATGLSVGNLGSALVEALGDLSNGTFTYQELFDAINSAGSVRYGSGTGRIQNFSDNWNIDVESSFSLYGDTTTDFSMVIEVPEPSLAAFLMVIATALILRRTRIAATL